MLGKSCELYDSGSEERFSALRIASAIVVKSGGDLDQALQKRLFRLGFDQPNFLPDLVSFEKFLRVEVGEPALKFLVFFGSVHRVCIGFRIESAVDGRCRHRRDLAS